MRSLALITLFGTVILTTGMSAQSLTEHAAAAAGATAGTAAGKPVSDAMSKIFGATEKQTKTAATATIVKTPSKTESQPSDKPSPITYGAASGSSPLAPAPGTSTPPARAARPRRIQQDVATTIDTQIAPAPIAAPIVVEPPVVKEPTMEQLASVQVGTTGDDVRSLLGTPASHLSIPDDDGHFRESYQFWAKGAQLGTVRLDNGRVVKVELRNR